MTQRHSSPRIKFANPAKDPQSRSEISSAQSTKSKLKLQSKSSASERSSPEYKRGCCQHCRHMQSEGRPPPPAPMYASPHYAHHAPDPQAWSPPLGGAPTLAFAPLPPMPFLAPATAARSGLPIPIPRLHPFAPAPVLHHLGGPGPEPLFGWESVIPLPHSYGSPKYLKRVKPDYRRFCFSVGKAEKPYAALPGGPLEGMPTWMSSMLV